MKRLLMRKVLFVCMVSIGISCQKQQAVVLKVDFSQAESWQYSFSADINGTFSYADSLSRLFSTIRCILSGVKENDPGILTVRAQNITISSNVLDQDEQRNMINSLSTAQYRLVLSMDFPHVNDSLLGMANGIGDWDIYRQLLKVLPAFPSSAIKPGYTWERTRQLPVTTSQGKAGCELYQSFTFDSIGGSHGENQRAYISWLFRYAVDRNPGDTASQLGSLPGVGNGKAAAVIDITNNRLVAADMVFSTPVCSLSQLTMGWEEKASLMLVTDTL